MAESNNDSSRFGPSRPGANFGLHETTQEEKSRLVQRVFTSVAPRYDLMNDLMSAGAHRLWKDALIDWLAPRRGTRLLDVAGGTGDVARRYLARVQGDGQAVVCDRNAAMLEAGRKRERRCRSEENDALSWICGNALALPFAGNTFDYVTIAFGIRNVAHVETALSQALRVLRPGGRFMCLEFSRPPDRTVRGIYDRYSFSVIPRLGRWVGRDEASYRYLVESIRRFPDQPALARMMEEAGFFRVRWRNLAFGVAAIHSAWRF